MALPASGAPRRWRNVPLVRQADPRKARRAMRLLAAVGVALLPLGFYLFAMMEHTETRYALEELRGQHERLLEQERRLRIDRAALASLPDVERRARSELGLVRPAAPDVVVLERGAVPRTEPREPVPSARGR